MSAEEREQRAQRQAAHAEKIRLQREAAEEVRRREEASRKAQARQHAGHQGRFGGIMGVGRVPVDVGGVEGAYEFELEHAEVTIYVPLPAGVSAKQLAVDVGTRSLSVGLKGKPPYLKGALCGVVCDDDAIWTVENGFVKLELTKAATSAADNAAWHGALTLPSGWACEWHQ